MNYLNNFLFIFRIIKAGTAIKAKIIAEKL